MLLYSDEPENRHPIDVRLLTLGSQYSLVFHQLRADTIEGAVGFTDDPAYGELCALGYQMTTEGLALGGAHLVEEDTVAGDGNRGANRGVGSVEQLLQRGLRAAFVARDRGDLMEKHRALEG